MEQERVQKLAAQIALLLQEEAQKPNEFSVLRSSIEKIGERLGKIEEKLESRDFVAGQSVESKSFPAHPSQEKFQNLEELADKIISSYQNEKACPYEPTGKPCDHCAMCNSRGF